MESRGNAYCALASQKLEQTTPIARLTIVLEVGQLACQGLHVLPQLLHMIGYFRQIWDTEMAVTTVL